MIDLLNITKALSDRNRVRAMMALAGRELCVCQIIEFLGLAPSTASKHMSILRNARLVESRKEGLWIHYRLPKRPSREVKKAIEWLRLSLDDDEEVLEDRRRIQKILKMDIDEICRKQNGRRCCNGKKKEYGR